MLSGNVEVTWAVVKALRVLHEKVDDQKHEEERGQDQVDGSGFEKSVPQR